MTTPRRDEADWKLVSDLLEDRLGWSFEGVRRNVLAARIEGRIRALGLESMGEYYRYLRFHPEAEAEIEQLTVELTNNETYFFREGHHFEILAATVVPAHRSAAPLRILSAGCSSGEEPYSIAIRLLEAAPPGARWEIEACDVNPLRLEQAKSARYGEGSLRRLSEEERERYFVRDGERWILRPAFRRVERFHRTNLLEGVRTNGNLPYDAIFCRNVLIYFGERGFERTLGHFARALKPGGYLFLGHSESLPPGRGDFEAVTVGRRVVYRLKGGA